jgi:hypothetical protein
MCVSAVARSALDRPPLAPAIAQYEEAGIDVDAFAPLDAGAWRRSPSLLSPAAPSPTPPPETV